MAGDGMKRSRLKRTPFRRKQRQGVRTFKDGRVAYSGCAYTQLRQEVWAKQGGRCADCGEPVLILDFELHHPGGRGMAGSKRDDRKVVGLCGGIGSCHEKRTREGNR
jgi:hypothetical protein